MTLRLPELGTEQGVVSAAIAECASEGDVEPTSQCRFHGRILPLPADCEDGCTWWSYRFTKGRLTRAELDRTHVDVTAADASARIAQAHEIAAEISRRLGAPPDVDDTMLDWATLEGQPEGTEWELERKVWRSPERRVTWTVTGIMAHHPVVRLRVVVDDDLRVLHLAPTTTIGAPLLELAGGPLPRPFAAPLWLELSAADDDECGIHNDAVAFELDDGRVYLAQYNAWCGGRACRIIDPRSRAVTTPAACLFGAGIHHRVEPIGRGDYLLWSDAEGGGTVSIEHYDPEVGSDTRLSLSLSTFATIDAEIDVDDASVVFVTPCELPRGCEYRDYTNVPSKRWRWSSELGLRPDPTPP